MSTIDTGLVPLYTKKSTSTPLFVPMTGPINSTLVNLVRHRRWLEAATPGFTARIAYQMSHDGVSWSGTVTAPGAFSATQGWVYNDAAGFTVNVDPRLFVRFGLECQNVSGTLLEQALGRLVLSLRPVMGKTMAVANRKVFTNGTTTRVFHPLLGPVPLEDIGEHRPTIELTAMSASAGGMLVIPALQVSDDGITWYDTTTPTPVAGAFTTFGTERSSEGTEYGTSFVSFAPGDGAKMRMVRYGVAAKNSGAGANETALVSMRLDYRRTT